MAKIPSGITREHVLQALADFDAGARAFKGSTSYDLVHAGRKYPPKAIVALAAQRATGTLLRPREFSGGMGSKCFSILEEAGFEIVRKTQ